MYKQEKIIDGVLHYKNTPDGEWKEYSKEQLTERVIKYKNALTKIRDWNDDYGR